MKLDCTISKIEDEVGIEIVQQQSSKEAQYSVGKESVVLNEQIVSASENPTALNQEIVTPMVKISGSKTSASTSAMHAKEAIFKAPLVVIEVWRSVKLRGKSDGFKSDISNPSKDCICCSIVPPILSSKMIRSLGNDFYNIPLHHISDEALQKKGISKKKAAVGQASRPVKKSSSQDDDKKTKKIRKHKEELCDEVLYYYCSYVLLVVDECL
jgi:hypothetical protein